MTEGRRTAILIAASEFPEEPSLQTLRCPKNDVAGLAEALTSPDFGLFTDPLTFINEPSHSTLRAINRVFKEAGRDDQILIYYSGHGKQDGAGFTKHILQGIMQGEADHDDDGMISLDDLYEYALRLTPATSISVFVL